MHTAPRRFEAKVYPAHKIAAIVSVLLDDDGASAAVAPSGALIWFVVATSLLFSAVLAIVSARTAWRVTFWAGVATALTSGVGFTFGVAA